MRRQGARTWGGGRGTISFSPSVPVASTATAIRVVGLAARVKLLPPFIVVPLLCLEPVTKALFRNVWVGSVDRFRVDHSRDRVVVLARVGGGVCVNGVVAEE